MAYNDGICIVFSLIHFLIKTPTRNFRTKNANPTGFRRHVASPSRLPPKFLVAPWFALAEEMR